MVRSWRPPWIPHRKKVLITMVIWAFIGAMLLRLERGADLWCSVVDRREAISSALLSVHTAMLGFAVATVAILISVRAEPNMKRLDQFKTASYEMWTSLLGACWSTAVASAISLASVILATKTNPFVASTLMLAVLLATTFAALAVIDVVTVVHVLVALIRPAAPSAQDMEARGTSTGIVLGGPDNQEDD